MPTNHDHIIIILTAFIFSLKLSLVLVGLIPNCNVRRTGVKIKTKKNKKEFSRQLLAYATTAAGVLAVAPAANAAIVYSGAKNLPVDNAHTPVNVTMDGSVHGFHFFTSSSTKMEFGRAGSTGATSAIVTFTSNSDANLAPNYSIRSSLAAGKTWNNATTNRLFSTGGKGFFSNTTGFLGVRFQGNCAPGSFHYGWIRFQGLSNVNGNISGTIIDWAYEDVCNTPIAAGAGIPTAVPTVTEWGAMGMAGLLAAAAVMRLRKRNNQEQ